MSNFSSKLRNTIYLRILGILKIPLISYLSPTVQELSQDVCVIRLPLRRRAKNHHGSMYFGALATGADCTAGFLAFHLIKRSRRKISLIFKGFEAQFLKRPEGDVYFSCIDGKKITGLIEQAVNSEDRVEDILDVTARVPSKLGDEPVARFRLVLSLKCY